MVIRLFVFYYLKNEVYFRFKIYNLKFEFKSKFNKTLLLSHQEMKNKVYEVKVNLFKVKFKH